jgi:hypothetical protein
MFMLKEEEVCFSHDYRGSNLIFSHKSLEQSRKILTWRSNLVAAVKSMCFE